ncbi:MAG: membrane protein insertase YidC [Acidobacteria bacterium]|nr:membrane protein insertase YidC [Acidobacteriota bacterium]MBV9145781.1 membrane protein insertase YidC [Acidobacteriota bacterium]MBV9435360.1 membrane protein insertase YidC [Acidobacteriota bacterium]
MSDFQAPNQDPGAERRLLLTFALTFVIIFITQQFISRYYKPSAPAAQKQEQTSPPPAAPAVPSKVENTPPTPKSPAVALKQSKTEETNTIENDLYKIKFSNRGAVATSWVLKKYKDDSGKPLELVNAIAAPQFGYPLSFFTYDKALSKKLNQDAVYVHTEKDSGQERSITFEYADADVAVTKKFIFGDSYEVHVETSVMQKGGYVTAYPSWPAGFGDETVTPSYAAARIDIDREDKVERISYKKVSGGATVNGPFNWAGSADQYFTAVFLPDDPDHTSLVTQHEEISIPKNLDKPDPKEQDKVPVLGAAVGMPGGVTAERIFVGPKALEVISDVRSYSSPAGGGVAPNGPSLEKLVDFGTFSFFAKPLFLWLRWTYEHWTANYGWAILILTVIINVALLPLRISSIKSAMRMQKLQPQVTAINDKYKRYKLTDPRQADKNRELQDLYKREGVNPLGGCLPNLLQLPFLWAFYTMLGSAIELRHAQWFWIRDLSSPSHLLTILFVITMFLTQQLTPQAGMDPAQQKMMQVVMPIMLGVFTWNLSAGLSLYWAAGNVIGIVQQLAFNRTKFGREMRAHMQKRAMRKR